MWGQWTLVDLCNVVCGDGTLGPFDDEGGVLDWGGG